MYQVQDEPVERLYLYIVRDDEQPPSLLPLALSILSLLLVLAVGVLFPYRPPLVQRTMAVPVLLLPVQTLTTTKPVIPTGVQTIPATQATGVVTIYNGSILAEQLPQGMILTGTGGVEIVTDITVVVPGANPPAYGMATVSVHAVMPGSRGNLAALAIDQVYGTSLYLRNLHPLIGGHDALTRRVLTAQDRATALAQAHANLTHQLFTRLLYHPCLEQVVGTNSLQVTWTCQFFTYTVPSLPQARVLHMHIIGRTVFLTITYVPRPPHLETK